MLKLSLLCRENLNYALIFSPVRWHHWGSATMIFLCVHWNIYNVISKVVVSVHFLDVMSSIVCMLQNQFIFFEKSAPNYLFHLNNIWNYDALVWFIRVPHSSIMSLCLHLLFILWNVCWWLFDFDRQSSLYFHQNELIQKHFVCFKDGFSCPSKWLFYS